MPQETDGTFPATQQCQTVFAYNASGTLATSTETCYRQQDVYTNLAIEGAFIAGTVLFGLVVAKFYKK